VDRPKEIGGLPQVFHRQIEEKGFARFTIRLLLADGIVVEVRVLIAWSKIEGLEVSPVIEKSSM
jgi:hypothetical protein